MDLTLLISLSVVFFVCGNAVHTLDLEDEKQLVQRTGTELLSQQDGGAYSENNLQSISLQLDVSKLGNSLTDQSDSVEMKIPVTVIELTSVEGLIVTKENMLHNLLHDESLSPPELELRREVDPSDGDNVDFQQEQLHNHMTFDDSMETPVADVAEHSFDVVNSSHADNLSSWGWIFVLENCLSGMDQWINILIDHLPLKVQKLFTNAPLDLNPARCLMVFLALSVVVLTIFIPAFHSAMKYLFTHLKENDVAEQLFAAENAVIVAEQENVDLRKELETFKLRVHDYQERSTLSTTVSDDLTIERDRLQKLLSEQEGSIAELQSTVETQECGILKLGNENAVLKVELQQAKDQVAETQTKLSELQISLQQYQTCELEMQSQLQSMSEEISIIQTSKDQLLMESTDCTAKMQDMCEELSQIREEQKCYQDALSLKDCELTELKKCFHHLKIFEKEMSSVSDHQLEISDSDATNEEIKSSMQKKLNDMLDVANINAKLQAVQEECQSCKRTLSIEVESRLKLEENLKETKEEMFKIIESRHEAEQQVNAAKVKMDVLSSYFKDKEKELIRKLSEQEARERANADQLVNTDVRTKEFEAMVYLYKEQVEDLQKEIQKIEADYRRQIAAQEKKAHENWLSARQSERDLKEQKVEAQLLRQKIIELQTKLDALSDELRITKESRAELPAINEIDSRSGTLHGDGSLPIWRGVPPLIVKPRPFFPPGGPIITGDRPPLRIPLRFHDSRLRSPVPSVFERRYPTDVTHVLSRDRSSPRDKNISPPLIRSLPLAMSKDNNALDYERCVPLHDGDRRPSDVVRPLPHSIAGTMHKGSTKDPTQPRIDRPPGSSHWSSSSPA